MASVVTGQVHRSFNLQHYPIASTVIEQIRRTATTGPAINLLLALAAGILYHAIDLLPEGLDSWVEGNLVNAITFNVFKQSTQIIKSG